MLSTTFQVSEIDYTGQIKLYINSQLEGLLSLNQYQFLFDFPTYTH